MLSDGPWHVSEICLVFTETSAELIINLPNFKLTGYCTVFFTYAKIFLIIRYSQNGSVETLIEKSKPRFNLLTIYF